jgi:hypothetical protein
MPARLFRLALLNGNPYAPPSIAYPRQVVARIGACHSSTDCDLRRDRMKCA